MTEATQYTHKSIINLPENASRGEVKSTFFTTEEGNPTGGISEGPGFKIAWQNGVQEPNGATLEDVIQVCVDRLLFFNSTKFSCRENSLAITKFEEGLHWLNHRTQARKERGVEGSYQV